MTMRDYRDFLASKRIKVEPSGFSIPEERLPPKLFDWQRKIVHWSLRQGRADLFEECGLGKGQQQLAWCDAVIRHGGCKRVILLAPLAVAFQMLREAEKFQIETEIRYCREGHEVGPGINVVNYERLHKFDCKLFDAVDGDELSILKSYTGKTKQKLCESFNHCRFKLGATATPAPNDLMELGNQSEFLQAMPSNEMLARWFVNAGDSVGKYRLRKHAVRDFWRWVASWAVCLTKPGDLGFPNDGFDLPPLEFVEHLVEVDRETPAGHLFDPGAKISATTMHTEKRSSIEARAAKTAELVAAAKGRPFIVWCDTDYEADALKKAIPGDFVEVRGSHSVEQKEKGIQAFLTGGVATLITKPKIAGFGLNLQFCHDMAFVGLSWSFEQLYQAVRRCWRFGQLHPVAAHVIQTEAESAIAKAVWSKQRQHEEMQSQMAAAMREFQIANVLGRRELAAYAPTVPVEVPTWLHTKV
jgi:hypothetical protein